MAVAMSDKIRTPKTFGLTIGSWEVWVSADGGETEEWAAKCDTFDDAVELAGDMSKTYYVSISARP